MEESARIATYIRRHGPFEPHRLPAEEMEYTSLPGVMAILEDRLEDMELIYGILINLCFFLLFLYYCKSNTLFLSCRWLMGTVFLLNGGI